MGRANYIRATIMENMARKKFINELAILLCENSFMGFILK